MTQAQTGDSVKVHYTGTLDDGSQFDTSRDREPLEFKIGDKDVIPGFEKMVIGMAVGETKSEKIPAEDAYGPYHSERVLEVDRNNIPQDADVKVGMILEMRHQDGRRIPVVVKDISDDKLTLDANHPLAGKDLTFEIELLEIN